jgi:hypothetical protein
MYICMEYLHGHAVHSAKLNVPYRWQSILRQHSGSGRLWRAYTAWQRTRFASFTTSSMRQAHRQALSVRPHPQI